MVVHYAGYACDMPAILAIAQAHNLAVIEDAAHAVGAMLDGRHLGTWGDVGCYSFFANKNLTTAEGGMLVTNDDALAETVRVLRSHGMTTLTWDRHHGHASTYDVVGLGYNYRIDELRSALGRVQLGRVLKGNHRRGELAALYRQMLADQAPQVTVPFTQPRGQSSYHIMPVLLPPGSDKLAFMAAMKEAGIQTSWHYPPVHLFKIYRQLSERDTDFMSSVFSEGQKPAETLGSQLARLKGAEPATQPSKPAPLLRRPSLQITEAVSRREVTLPLYPTMTDEQVEWVVEAVAGSL
jgi:dTDP-4-amino-4,6-dideoxygalactose transaminase